MPWNGRQSRCDGAVRFFRLSLSDRTGFVLKRRMSPFSPWQGGNLSRTESADLDPYLRLPHAHRVRRPLQRLGGCFSSSSRTISIAFSSCGSLPAITSAGHCSTSTSGGTPSFSTTQPSSVQMARFGRGHRAAVHQHREAEDADQAAPGPLADQRAELELAEHPGQQVAAGAGRLVDEHHLRARGWPPPGVLRSSP